jgi:Rad51
VVLPQSDPHLLRMLVSMFQTYLTDMKCALDLLDQCGSTQKMSSGSAEIDSLIDGIQECSFYLFYSGHENQLILDSLLYRQLIGCILPKSNKKNGFESAAIYLNNIDFSKVKNKHQLLNPEKIAITSKYAGIEPKIVFKNLFVQTAYNQEHQAQIADEIANSIESNPDIKLLAIRDLTRFLVTDVNWNTSEDGNILKKTLGTLYRVCTKNKVAIVATGNCNVANNGIIPKPSGGTFLKHLLNVIVHIKSNSWSTTSTSRNDGSSHVSFKAPMIKHPYQKTPKSINFYARRIGKRINPMLFLLD